MAHDRADESKPGGLFSVFTRKWWKCTRLSGIHNVNNRYEYNLFPLYKLMTLDYYYFFLLQIHGGDPFWPTNTVPTWFSIANLFFSSHYSLFLHAITTTSLKEKKQKNKATQTPRQCKDPVAPLLPSILRPRFLSPTHLQQRFLSSFSRSTSHLIKNNKHSRDSFFGSLSISNQMQFHRPPHSSFYLFFLYKKGDNNKKKYNNIQVDTHK